jgi:hypothetical protein
MLLLLGSCAVSYSNTLYHHSDPRIRNRHNEKPIDLLPASYPGSNPASVDPESDDEKIRAAIRTAEAEAALGDAGDVVDGEWASGCTGV